MKEEMDDVLAALWVLGLGITTAGVAELTSSSWAAVYCGGMMLITVFAASLSRKERP